MAAPAAADVVVKAEAQVVVEAQVQLLDLAVLALFTVAPVVLVQRAVPVVAPAAEEDLEPLLHLLSRQWFSAAMARTTP